MQLPLCLAAHTASTPSSHQPAHTCTTGPLSHYIWSAYVKSQIVGMYTCTLYSRTRYYYV